MEIRCPTCRKRNEDDVLCRRCGCDLGPLQAVLTAAERQAARGELHLMKRSPGAALQAAERSWRLRHSARAARTAFLASVMLQAYEEACHWHRRATRI